MLQYERLATHVAYKFSRIEFGLKNLCGSWLWNHKIKIDKKFHRTQGLFDT